jgi:hypothetical protein
MTQREADVNPKQFLQWGGVIALFFGVYGFVVAGAAQPNTFGISNLESPADNLLHLVVGAWALYAAFMGRQAISTTT